jgi:hypothetical protein
MAKVWVLIDPVVSADGKEAKDPLDKATTKKIEEAIVERTADNLPSGKYTTKDSDKPKPKGKDDDHAPNAIKVTPQLKLKVEQKGRMLAVTGALKVEFEAIRWPKKEGNLIVAGSSKAGVENRGTVADELIPSTEQVLDEILAPKIKEIVGNKAVADYSEKIGLPE